MDGRRLSGQTVNVQRISKDDGRQLMDKLAPTKFSEFASSENFDTETQKVAIQLKRVDVGIDGPLCAYMTNSLPTASEWG